MTPVFFASALTNFGIENFFDAFVEMAPAAIPRTADQPDGTAIVVDPVERPFSAYIFKIQANMNPRHRDSTAFLRVCSDDSNGTWWSNIIAWDMTCACLGHIVSWPRTATPWIWRIPGDIIGIINPGQFAIGDTISLNDGFNYQPLPQFQPEVFAKIYPTDVGKRKAFDKGMEQMATEGTVQLLWSLDELEFLVGAVGRLQFDVLEFRLRNEYRVETRLEPLTYACSAWLVGDPDTFRTPSDARIVKDQLHRPIVLFRSPWSKHFAKEHNPDHDLLEMG